MRLPIASLSLATAMIIAGSQLFQPTVAATANEAGSDPSNDCNSILTTITTNDLRLLVDATANALDLQEESVAMFLENIQYDVLVSKVCGSCRDLIDDDDEDEDTVPPACFQYGNDAILSSIALHPLLLDGNDIHNDQTVAVVKQQEDEDAGTTPPNLLIPGQLNGFVGYRGFYADAKEQAFSDYFPIENFAQAILDNPWSHLEEDGNATNSATAKASGGGDGYKLFNSLIAPLLAASSGTIGILVDDAGTGESIDTVDRSYLTVVPCQQATAVAWRAVQNYTREISNGCTALANAATLSGYSAGGYKVVVGADTLRTWLKVEIQQVLAGGGVYDGGNVALVGLVGGFLAQGKTLDAKSFMSYSFYLASYSNPNATYLPNVAQGKPMASSLWLDATTTGTEQNNNILDWWMGPNDYTFDEQAALQPKTFQEQISMFDPALFNRTLRAALAGGIPTCHSSLDSSDNSNETTDDAIFCQSIQQNSAYPYFAVASYPVEWCHSPQDPVVPFALSAHLIPPNAFGMVREYEPPHDDLIPRGDHAMGDNLCSGGAAAAYFHRARGVFNKIAPLSASQQQQCRSQQEEDSTSENSSGEEGTTPTDNEGVVTSTTKTGTSNNDKSTATTTTTAYEPITPYDEEEEEEIGAFQQVFASSSSSRRHHRNGSHYYLVGLEQFIMMTIAAAAGSFLFPTTLY